MKDYIKELYDDLSKKMDDNMQNIAMLENLDIFYDEIRTKLDKAINQQDDVIDKIKEFINELEYNIQVDKDNERLISSVSCDYVAERLKNIIE